MNQTWMCVNKFCEYGNMFRMISFPLIGTETYLQGRVMCAGCNMDMQKLED